LPEYNIMIRNRAYKVELTKKSDNGLFEAQINSKPVRLEFERKGNRSISPSAIKIGGRKYKVELEKIVRHAPFELKIDGVPFKAELKELTSEITSQTTIVKAAATKPESASKELQTQEGVLIAPMAGKIVSVKVKKGDPVKVGDVICILEAMKMENEILASKSGKVREINLAEGKPVRDGDILAIIE
jgi:biotin carboxyl carrier protein